jgi:phage terminase large subunit GpA-like protein
MIAANEAAGLVWLDAIWRRGLAAEPQMLVSAWADRHRILPATSAEPGRWRNSRTPYLTEIMDCFSVSSSIERVIFQKSSQIGATEAALNFCGYVIQNAPASYSSIRPTARAAGMSGCGLIL